MGKVWEKGVAVIGISFEGESMEQIVRMQRCGLCNSRVDIREMKYHKSGSYLMCRNCHEKQSPGAKVAVQTPAPAIKSVNEVARKSPAKVSYRCKNCSYRFSRAQDYVFESCPYCGKKTVSVVERSAAQALIDDAA
ncbi:hypothetical protein HYV82_04280 [Candidatus Woesearchaeota archaeon]|nr:hypothetical protein [Candidatus Woesearchaeota archaeon]